MSLVEFEVADRIATITLNRPERKNALNAEMIVRLAEAWKKVRDDDEVRVAVVTGSGGASRLARTWARCFPWHPARESPRTSGIGQFSMTDTWRTVPCCETSTRGSQ